MFSSSHCDSLGPDFGKIAKLGVVTSDYCLDYLVCFRLNVMEKAVYGDLERSLEQSFSSIITWAKKTGLFG